MTATTLHQLHYTTTTPLRYNYDYSCSTPHYIQQLWMRWPLQPLQPLQQTQLQPPFGQSVDSICHPWFTTTDLSYRFPLLELPSPPCAVLLVQILLWTSISGSSSRGSQTEFASSRANSLKSGLRSHEKPNMGEWGQLDLVKDASLFPSHVVTQVITIYFCAYFCHKVWVSVKCRSIPENPRNTCLSQ